MKIAYKSFYVWFRISKCFFMTFTCLCCVALNYWFWTDILTHWEYSRQIIIDVIITFIVFDLNCLFAAHMAFDLLIAPAFAKILRIEVI